MGSGRVETVTNICNQRIAVGKSYELLSFQVDSKDVCRSDDIVDTVTVKALKKEGAYWMALIRGYEGGDQVWTNIDHLRDNKPALVCGIFKNSTTYTDKIG